MAPKVTFRRAQVSDAAALTALGRQLHGHARDISHWEWKYRGNPAEPMLTSIAEADNQIVGQIACVPMRVRVMGRTIPASQEVDVFIDENHRRGSTFFRLYKKRLELNAESGIALNYAVTIAQTSKMTAKIMQLVAPIPRLVKPLNLRPFLRRRIPIRILADSVAALANRTLTRVPDAWETVPTGTHFETVSRFDERFDRLWDHIANDYAVRVVKDAAYLNWRYCDIPDEHYESIALVSDEDNRVLGFVVQALKTGESVRGMIVDIVTPRSDEGRIGRPLLAHAISGLREMGADKVVCWMFPHCHLYPLLTKAGFRLREVAGSNLMVNLMEAGDTLALPADVPSNRESWYFVQGDHAAAL